MKPIAVGRFDEQNVGGLDWRGIGQHGAGVAAKIAAEKHGMTADPGPGVRGTEQMARIHELDLETRHDRHRPFVAHRLQLIERTRRIDLRVQRQRGVVLRIAVPIRLARVFFLNPRGVGQHEGAQVASAGRTEDAAAKTLRDEPRQVTTVIEMRMGQDHGVDRSR